MTKIYVKANGVKVEVDVTEAVADCLQACRRSEWNSDAKAKYHTTSLEKLEENGSIFADPSLSPEEAMIDREDKAEEMRKLKKAMATLSTEQRKIVHMRFVKRMELKEIGKIFGISLKQCQVSGHGI